MSNNDDDINTSEYSSYQGITDNIMAELQQKYNLRPRSKNIATAQPKKILSRCETYEPAPERTETQTAKIKGVDSQNAKKKQLRYKLQK
jgi:hypothetical protein